MIETAAAPSAEVPTTLAGPAAGPPARTLGRLPRAALAIALAAAVTTAGGLVAAAPPPLPIAPAARAALGRLGGAPLSVVAPRAQAALGRLGSGLVSVDAVSTRVDAVAVHGGGGRGGERERVALAMLRDGRADAIVAMGGPLPAGDPDRTYAGAVRRRLLALQAPPDRIVALPLGLSTRAELVALRQLAESRDWRRVALSTSPWHTLRVRLTAAEVFAGSPIAWSVVAGAEDVADGSSPADRIRAILGEWLKIAQIASWPSAGRL